MRLRRSHRSGFTLVELLVVIGIIALLLGILLPSLNKARERSKSAKCLSNIHQLLLAYQMYLADNHQVSLPYTNVSYSGYADPSTINWQEELRPYYARAFHSGNIYEDTSRNVRLCPDASDLAVPPGSAAYTAGAGGFGTAFTAYDYPLNATPSPTLPMDTRMVFGSYAFNGWLYQPVTDRTNDLFPSTQQLMGWSVDTAAGASVPSPALTSAVWLPQYQKLQVRPNSKDSTTTPVFGDANRFDAWPQPFNPGPVQGGYSLMTGPTAAPSSGTLGSFNLFSDEMGRFVTKRHGNSDRMSVDSVNVGFLDGHAGSVGLPGLWNLTWYKGWVPPTVAPN